MNVKDLNYLCEKFNFKKTFDDYIKKHGYIISSLVYKKILTSYVNAVTEEFKNKQLNDTLSQYDHLQNIFYIYLGGYCGEIKNTFILQKNLSQIKEKLIKADPVVINKFLYSNMVHIYGFRVSEQKIKRILLSLLYLMQMDDKELPKYIVSRQRLIDKLIAYLYHMDQDILIMFYHYFGEESEEK